MTEFHSKLYVKLKNTYFPFFFSNTYSPNEEHQDHIYRILLLVNQSVNIDGMEIKIGVT